MNKIVAILALAFCATVHADPNYCTQYRCSRADIIHDLRADQRRYERELDLRESERETQRMFERSMDETTRQMENMLRRNEYEDRRRYR